MFRKYYRKKRSHRGNHKRLRYLGACQNHRCCYCGKVCEYTKNYTLHNSATIEHVVPRAAGGNNDINNCVMACSRCNNLRKTIDVNYFIERRVWELSPIQIRLVRMQDAVLTFNRRERKGDIISLLKAFDKVCPSC